MVISSPAGHGRRTNKNSAESLSGTSAFRIPYFFLRSIVERFHIRRRFPPRSLFSATKVPPYARPPPVLHTTSRPSFTCQAFQLKPNGLKKL